MRPWFRDHRCIQILFFFTMPWGELWLGRILSCWGNMSCWDSQGLSWSGFCYGGCCCWRVSCSGHLWRVKLVKAHKTVCVRCCIWGRQGFHTISWYLLDPRWNFSDLWVRLLNNPSINRTFLFCDFLFALIFNDQNLLMDLTLIHPLWASRPFMRLLRNLIFMRIVNLSDWCAPIGCSGHFW